MMTVRSRSKGGPYARLTAGALIVAVIVIVGVTFGSAIRDAVVALFYSGSEESYATLTREALEERLTRAETELTRVRYQSILFDAVAGDLAALEKEVGLRRPESFVTALVVGAPPMTHYDTLVITAGESDGVRVGDLATVEGTLVGTVVEVGARSSIIALYSAPGVLHDAHLGEPAAIVSARGLGGGSLEATVPDDVQVAPGDLVRDQKTNIPFAVVSNVLRRDIDTTATVRMALAASVSTIRHVSLLHAEL